MANGQIVRITHGISLLICGIAAANVVPHVYFASSNVSHVTHFGEPVSPEGLLIWAAIGSAISITTAYIIRSNVTQATSWLWFSLGAFTGSVLMANVWAKDVSRYFLSFWAA